MKRVMCIWLPGWPLQRLCDVRPELREQAVVLHEPRDRTGARVRICSRRAVEQGVRPGMPITEAAALGDSGTLVLETIDPAADRLALEQLALWCERFSPIVALEDADPPCGLLCDVTGCEPLWPTERALAEHVVQALAQRRFTTRVAIADTIGAAWAICRSNRTRTACTVLEPGATAATLQPLPVAALRLNPDTVALLRELGIDSVGQLERLPRAGVAARFGSLVLERLDQAMGRTPELIVPYRPPPVIELQWDLECGTERHDVLEAVVERLARRLAALLEPRGHGAEQLECRLHGESGAVTELTLRLVRPSACPNHWMELIRVQLEQARLPGPIGRVLLCAPRTAPLEHRQTALFPNGREHTPRQLLMLIDRLSNRLGRDAVLRPRLVPDAQPERAFHYEPLIAAAPASTGRGKSNGRQSPRHPRAKQKSQANHARTPRRANRSADRDSTPPRAPRPLRLDRRPVPIHVVSLVPHGPPVRFDWSGRAHRILHAWGPERIETAWWRGRSVARDYYCVASDAGWHCWLFRRLHDGCWFLHGWFD